MTGEVNIRLIAVGSLSYAILTTNWMKAKSTPITTHPVTASTGEERKKWVASINKELESFYSNHAVEDATSELVARCREVGNYPLPCQMVCVLKPDLNKAPGPSGPAMKYKFRMVICGNREPREQDESNSTNNIDAPLLRWMLSAFCGKDTTWCSVAISTAFLTADIPPEHLVLLKPPKSLIDLKVIQESKIWLAVRAVHGLRAAPRLWEQSRDAKFATCEFKVDRKTYSLKQSVLAPSMWWILPIPPSEQKHRLPPDKRSDEQVSKWTEAKPVGVVGLYVDDTVAGTTKAICLGLMSWIKGVWNTGQVEYAGPDDPNTIRLLGLNLDYISKKQSSSDQPEGGVPINQLE
eukprot:399852-Amphidinium_carterae.3